jgi:D-aminopeptidase
MRARESGIPFEGKPGPHNAITDVKGVLVGHTTLISGEGKLIRGQGPIRTGVTAVLPRGRDLDPAFAGWYSLNGNGEMTGTIWIEESGFLQGPIMITNTNSVGAVRDAVIEWAIQILEANQIQSSNDDYYWYLPVVAETYDGYLNDINGFHIKPHHVFSALDTARSGDVLEGCVGGGTGMICHEFKGGIGTSSRQLSEQQGGYTIGVLVQANYGDRERLTIAGIRVGKELVDFQPEYHTEKPGQGSGSIIVVVATDAPLVPHQLKRIARRVPLGIARVGGIGANSSGDIFIAFSTANPGAAHKPLNRDLEMLSNDQMSPLFAATIEATEEAIINALFAAKTMRGINGNTVYGLPHDNVLDILRRHKVGLFI